MANISKVDGIWSLEYRCLPGCPKHPGGGRRHHPSLQTREEKEKDNRVDVTKDETIDVSEDDLRDAKAGTITGREPRDNYPDDSAR